MIDEVEVKSIIERLICEPANEVTRMRKQRTDPPGFPRVFYDIYCASSLDGARFYEIDAEVVEGARS